MSFHYYFVSNTNLPNLCEEPNWREDNGFHLEFGIINF